MLCVRPNNNRKEIQSGRQGGTGHQNGIGELLSVEPAEKLFCLSGRRFTLVTDSRPLSQIFAPDSFKFDSVYRVSPAIHKDIIEITLSCPACLSHCRNLPRVIHSWKSGSGPTERSHLACAGSIYGGGFSQMVRSLCRGCQNFFYNKIHKRGNVRIQSEYGGCDKRFVEDDKRTMTCSFPSNVLSSPM